MFLAVSEAGSMTTVASNLGMTQPAVSRIVGRLEADLGVRLFDRGLRPVRLTPAGEELRIQGRTLLAEAARVRAAIRDVGDAPVPAVRIGLIDSFAVAGGPALVRRLQAYAKHVLVWSGITSSLDDDLLHRKLDFVVSAEYLQGLGGFESHRLFLEPFVLVLPARMARAMRELRLDDLAQNHAFIAYSARSMISLQIDQYLERQSIAVRKIVEFDGTDSVLAMVAAGIGWAITTPLCLVPSRLNDGRIRVVPLPGPPVTRSLYLLHRSGEFGRLPEFIVQHAREVLGELVARDFRALAPWTEALTTIG